MNTLDRYIDLVAASHTARKGYVSPYAAGLDAAINGANQENCHFGWFNSKENTAEWSRGNREGITLKLRGRKPWCHAGASLAGYQVQLT